MIQPKIQEAVLACVQDGFVGVSLGIVHNRQRQTVHFGEAVKGINNSPHDHTIYEIGSITKTFAGLLLAQAVKDGKANYDDDIRTYIGHYPNLESNGQSVYLWHLITHVSGLPNLLPDRPELFQDPDYETLPFILASLFKNSSRSQLLAALREATLTSIPGTEFSYSNAAAQLLGYILEDLFQCSFEEAIERNITKPLGMTRTRIRYLHDEDCEFAKGYNENQVAMPDYPAETQAAGALKSCVADMLAYLEFQLDRQNFVAQETQRRFMGDEEYGVGLNWNMRTDSKNQTVIWQSGGTFGFSSYSVMIPKESLAVIILTNGSYPNSSQRLEQLSQEVIDTVTK